MQEEPPLFARESSLHKYSKAFKELVESCLTKDPAKRPSAAELLETPFLKSAKKENYLVNTVLSMYFLVYILSVRRYILITHRGPPTARKPARPARPQFAAVTFAHAHFNILLGLHD